MPPINPRNNHNFGHAGEFAWPGLLRVDDEAEAGGQRAPTRQQVF